VILVIKEHFSRRFRFAPREISLGGSFAWFLPAHSDRYCAASECPLVGALRKSSRDSLMVAGEMAPELTGHGLPLIKCEAYNRVYEQHYGSS
jgi:hypothetical protein